MTPLLREAKGRIINTTSAQVYITIPMYSAYPSSKAALRIHASPHGVGAVRN
jgi:short-subunit dehydrogenase